MRSRMDVTISFCLVLLAVTLAYLPILPATLVADDYRLLSPGFLERPLKYFGRDLFPDNPGQVYWRPLPVLTFALDRALRGTGSVVPHVTNLLLHLATTAALGVLILSAGRPGTGASSLKVGAVGGMLLFGLHPQAAGAVAWVAARFDLLAGLFGTIGLVLGVRRTAAVEANPGRIILILLLLAAALLCKESALAFPAAMFLWTLIETLGRRSAARRNEDLVFLISLAALVVSYVALRMLLIGHVGASSGGAPFGVFWSTAVGYLLALVWPFTGTGAPLWLPLYCGVTTLIVIVLVGWSVLRREETAHERGVAVPWRLPVLLLVVSLAGLTVGGLKVEPILRGAESRLSYVPLIATGTLVGWLLQRAWTSGRWWLPGMALLLVACTAFAWTQQYRVSEWKDAGQRVDRLLAETMEWVPDPPPNSKLVFYGIPLTTGSYCYVFGIGLPEALAERYGRSDLQVIRWGKALKEVPKDAYVFTYHTLGGYLTLDRRPE